MMEGVSIVALALIAIALVLIAIVAYAYKKGKKIKINKTMFAVGLTLALVTVLMTFCQERCFLRVDLEGWPMVLGIIGIGLIATSQFRPLKSKKKK